MKKLYRRGGTVHPSPPIISDHLSFLPAAILSLAAALSLDDREVLAYLISSSSSSNSNKTNNTHLNSNSNSNSSSSPYNSPRGTTNRKSSGGGGGDHPARFNCNCFRCYTSYWVRWDESPNRELIHEIIDAFEEGLLAKTKAPSSSSSSSKLSRKERRNHNKRVMMKNKKEDRLVNNNNNNNNKVEESASSVVISSGDVDDDEENKGSVRRFVSFVGERIWGTVWRSTI